jgi:hypothetical protein
MKSEILKYRDWTIEFDKELTIKGYESITAGGAETCICSDCKNYIANRENIFPKEVFKLFSDLGIDYKKDVEICTYGKLPNGLYQIDGWFHFKGKIINALIWNEKIPNGYSLHLTKINENFSIGFCKDNALTFFNDKEDLVQLEFEAFIPWIIDEKPDDEL